MRIQEETGTMVNITKTPFPKGWSTAAGSLVGAQQQQKEQQEHHGEHQKEEISRSAFKTETMGQASRAKWHLS
jgi:hypothetical protein